MTKQLATILYHSRTQKMKFVIIPSCLTYHPVSQFSTYHAGK